MGGQIVVKLEVVLYSYLDSAVVLPQWRIECTVSIILSS